VVALTLILLTKPCLANQKCLNEEQQKHLVNIIEKNELLEHSNKVLMEQIKSLSQFNEPPVWKENYVLFPSVAALMVLSFYVGDRWR
jgi:hypothetical protein